MRMRSLWRGYFAAVVVLTFQGSLVPAIGFAQQDKRFHDEIAPLLGRRCLGCHNEKDAKGGLSLASHDRALAGGATGPSIVPGDESASWLLDLISGDSPEMPKDADPLSPEQVDLIRRWIQEGAEWPAGATVQEPVVQDRDWWSLRPLPSVVVPQVDEADRAWIKTPVDAFVITKLRAMGLRPSASANRRTLIRRLYFDLIGLPPTPEQIAAFVQDNHPLAYERLVDELLQSPHYGERWARHWLDVVHYGDTHGYDKDKLRPNAWPYRDYVIRSLNDDKRYDRFVREQLAGDVLWPDSRDGIEAIGFIAAGPWDFIGHAEVPEEKIDGKVARNLDRDDMVSSTINTFMSTTVQCARCHNHKFDPITQEHYYSLQAIFAALDRADMAYDLDATVAHTRRQLSHRQSELQARKGAWEEKLRQLGGEQLAHLDRTIAEVKQRMETKDHPEFGFHSQIESDPLTLKWVQVDLTESRPIQEIVLNAANDDFNGIGAGFGFPARYKVEVADDPEFQTGVLTVADFTQADVPNPGVRPQRLPAAGSHGRYVRITATKLALRSSDYIFALAEAQVFNEQGENLAAHARVTSGDSIEAPPRWQRINLVDGFYSGSKDDGRDAQVLVQLQDQRTQLLGQLVTSDMRSDQESFTAELAATQSEIDRLPAQQYAYVGMVHRGSGAFLGRGHAGGKPRDIHVLHRGNVTSPGELVGPGALPLIDGVDWRFSLPEEAAEGVRRVALADWIVRTDNPLTWRSIVNRVWLYHFGNGIVATPNDFGRMGEKPSHPELLDWLASHFRDHGQSLKALHRLIVNSNTYRQSSATNAEFSTIDGENRFLWRMNRRGLEAEVLRDTVLVASGKMDLRMYGPAFQDFVLERPEHSPHYEYHKHNPDDVTTHRRSIYRFLVRSQQQPFMQTLDCADPSQSVAKRDTTVTAIQALAMLNNQFMVRMAQHFAQRVQTERATVAEQLDLAFELAIGRQPSEVELSELLAFANMHGLENACRLILNLNEFMFVD